MLGVPHFAAPCDDAFLYAQRMRLAHADFSNHGEVPAYEGMLLWLEIAENHEQCLLNTLRERVGPHADIVAAYRQWVECHSAERDYVWRRTAATMWRAGQGAATTSNHRQ
jgi:hypothetical protein